MNFIEIKTDVHIKELANLANEIWHEYWIEILSYSQIDYMVNKFQSYNAIKNQIKDDKYIYHILENNGIFVGYFGICPQNNYLFLSKLYIKKDFRNLGYGKHAFNKIKLIAIECGKQEIRLTVNKNNLNTIKVYEKWGFNTINAVVSDIGSGFVMDDFIMAYKLKENQSKTHN